MRRLAMATLLVVAALSTSAFAASQDQVGKQLKEFSLPDLYGRARTLAEFGEQPLLVMVYLGTECPLARIYGPRLAILADEYKSKGVAFVGVSSNSQDSITELQAFARQTKIEFPILKDRDNELADRMDARRTPEVYVLDRDRVVRYCGRIDDQFGIGFHKQEVAERDLVRAIDELIAGKEVSHNFIEAPGCLIGRVHKVSPTGDVTFAEHVAPILNRRCVECHRSEQIAPFALTEYEEVAGWATMIREVLKEKRMPPWFADSRYGKFTNDCSMSDEERQVVYNWIDNGCPSGDLAKRPPLPKLTQGWRIPEPDMVLYMDDKPYTVPAEGVVEYQHFTVDPGFTEDKWIQACEARPGNPAVVHHIVVTVKPPGAKGYQLSFGDKLACVYAPGMPPWSFPEGTAVPVPAGSKFMIQMHYTTNGLAQDDRSFIGLKFADPSTVKTKAQARMALNVSIKIPPGAEDYVLHAKHKFRRDMYVLNLFPHMHWRGRSFRMEAEYPDGSREILLDVPNYDFNWQLRYDLAQPKLMPKGAILHCTAHYDNSTNNPYNPDPTATVTFGEQTWQEMLVGFFTATETKPDANEPDAKVAAGGE